MNAIERWRQFGYRMAETATIPGHLMDEAVDEVTALRDRIAEFEAADSERREREWVLWRTRDEWDQVINYHDDKQEACSEVTHGHAWGFDRLVVRIEPDE